MGLALVQPKTTTPPQALDIPALDKEVRQAVKNLHISTVKLGYYGFRLRFQMGGKEGNTGNLWPSIGFASEDKYRETLGVSRPTWFRAIAVGQALCHLSLEDMEQISLSNAEMLILVDPAIIQDFAWIDEAKKLPAQDFALLVASRNKQSGSGREPTTYFRCKVPVTAKKFLEDVVEKFRLENNLASSGEALELLIADVHDRPNTLAAVKRAMDYITQARKIFLKQTTGNFLKRRNREDKELGWLYEAETILRRVYNAECMGGEDAEDAEEVHPAEGVPVGQGHGERFGIVSQQSRRQGREESPDHETVEDSGWPLRAVQSDDGLDGDDVGNEGAEG